MSSRNTSPGQASTSSESVVNHIIFRSHTAENHQVIMTERVGADGKTVAVINHKARGYDEDEPTPDYGQTQVKPKKPSDRASVSSG